MSTEEKEETENEKDRKAKRAKLAKTTGSPMPLTLQEAAGAALRDQDDKRKAHVQILEKEMKITAPKNKDEKEEKEKDEGETEEWLLTQKRLNRSSPPTLVRQRRNTSPLISGGLGIALNIGAILSMKKLMG